MGLIKNVKKIMLELEEIKKTLTPSVINKANKYDETKEHLSNVELKVSNIVEFIDNNGNKGLKVFYEVSPIILQLDDDSKEIIYDKKFVSINMLNLISNEDMNKISKKIEENFK